MRNLIGDIKLASKLLWKDRGFTATVLLTLAVCIGANTATFTVVNSVLLRPLPVPESDRILLLSNQYPGAGIPETYSVAIPDYLDRRRDMTAFEDQAVFRSEDHTIEINGTPERLKSMRMTPSLIPLLRTSPAVGRAFSDADGEIGNQQKVILSDGLWQQLYGGNQSIVGHDMRISGRPHTIVGVMPRNFVFFDPEVRLWLPHAFSDKEKSDDSRHSNNSVHIGRLRPGATIEQAQAQVSAINAANLERFPKFREILINAGFGTHVWPLQDVLVRDVKNTLYLLWGGAAFVLLIGGVNIANLVLARSSLRRKELTTRLALGASRFQVARHLVVESVLVALAGGAAGIALGAITLRAITTLGLDQIPRAAEIHMDLTVVVFALATSLVVGVLIGLVPLAHLTQVNLSTVLREESRTGTGRRSRAVRRGLVVAQVGLAFVLLIGAGLLFASFRRLLAVDPGFKAEGVITVSTAVPDAKYPGPAEIRRFIDRTLQSVRAIPGVTAAGATTAIPFSDNFNQSVILAEGYQMKPGESLVAPMQVVVTPGYFEAMGTPLKRGRYFTEQDTDKAPGVVIVDERLARKFWGDADPVGRRMYESGDEGDVLKIDEKTKWWTVVGVIRDVQLADLIGSRQAVGTYYYSMAQQPSSRFTLAIKTTANQAALTHTLQAEMAKLDPEVPLFEIRSMADRTRLSLMSRRAAMLLASAFAGIALFLSAIGIYGVLTYLVAQRTREIGIRIALGGSRTDIFGLVLREGTILVLVGVTLGLLGSRAMKSAIESQVFGVQPSDPLVLGIVAASLIVVAIGACLLPARRATQVDPLIVLNS